MIPFFIYHPTEQTFEKVHHMPEIGDKKKNKTKSLTLMISQIIPYRTTWGSTPGFNNEKKKSQKKKNLSAIDVLFCLGHTSKIKAKILSYESNYDLLKLNLLSIKIFLYLSSIYFHL